MYDPSLSFQRKPDPSDYHYQFRLTNYFFLVFRTREIYWKHHERGLLDDETYRSYRQVFALGKDNPFFISVWNFTAESGMLSRGFTEETNTFMLEELGMNLNHPDALLYDIQMMLNQP